jgi:hypothetical protein
MVRVPASWAGAVAGLAGSQRGRGISAQPIRTTPVGQYTRLVTVDLGNDGVANPATFTAGGAAQAFVGPSGLGQSWALDQCYLSTSTGQLDLALCSVYAGPQPVPTMLVTGSLQGGSSQFGLGGIGIPDGWFVWALWTGGTPGALAYLRVTGTKTVLTT